MEVSDQHHAPATLRPGKNPGGWVGPRDALDALEKEKIFPLPSFVARTAQPIA